MRSNVKTSVGTAADDSEVRRGGGAEPRTPESPPDPMPLGSCDIRVQPPPGGCPAGGRRMIIRIYANRCAVRQLDLAQLDALEHKIATVESPGPT
jgi:hypothetical protein